ncbi:MAG: hypothetical protein ABL994_23930, partial [Verrucomicrobiales bacterium]
MKIEAGMSVDDFRNSMREQFSQGRMDGESPFGPRKDENARAANSPNAPFKPRERERVTVDLPPKYSELDTDFDGQIGIYEWLMAKRESLDMFDQIDLNVDGLLTPSELAEFDTVSSSGESKVTTYKRERLTIVGGPSDKSMASSGSGASRGDRSEKKEERGEARAEHEESARRYFGFMDRDRDGQIGMEEWEQSRRLKPAFEAAGIKIEPMSEKDFIKKYAK